MITSRYYDEELLSQLGSLDNIHWLFAKGEMSHFIKIKDHAYRDLTLKFLSILHVEVTNGPQHQARYVSFYLQG